VRWTGFSNFELTYNGKIILLDTYYDRGAIFPPLGVKAADIKKADVLLIGRGHVDHMSDAASIGARTGATVVSAPVTTEKLATQPIAARPNSAGAWTARFSTGGGRRPDAAAKRRLIGAMILRQDHYG
jgi:L-ascorbate metabolism protein UlaG (beta-lactamase superfamily)